MSILNNALSGAIASQVALSASSQNVANLQTKGYTRQSALLGAVAPSAGSNQAGNGVRVTELMRFSDGYKTQQLWRSASDLGARSQTQPYLTQLEQVMGDDTASLSSGVDAFFSALNSKRPSCNAWIIVAARASPLAATSAMPSEVSLKPSVVKRVSASLKVAACATGAANAIAATMKHATRRP